MGRTHVDNNNVNNNRSCCGVVYNSCSKEITDNVFVDDKYVKIHTVTWLRSNAEKYVFVGNAAKTVKKRLELLTDVQDNIEEGESVVRDFFALLANNPMCVENGVGILSDTYIISKSLDGYFVLYKAGFMLPFACLEHFVQDRVIPVQKEFTQLTANHANDILKLASACLEHLDAGISRTKIRKVATLKRAVTALITFVIALAYTVYCAVSIDWKNYGYISENTDGFFQAISFAAENGFGINHNNPLIILMLVLGVVWLIYLLFTNIKAIKELRSAIRYEKLKKVLDAASLLRNKLPDLYDNVLKSSGFISENADKFSSIYVKQAFPPMKFGPSIELLAKMCNSTYDKKMRRTMPGNFLLIVGLLLALVSAFLMVFSRAEAVQSGFAEAWYEGYNGGSGKLSKADTHILSYDTDVYTLADSASFVLLRSSAGTKCTVLDSESSENMFRVSVPCEYGRIEGWVDSASVEEFNPYFHSDLVKTVPNSVHASSELVSSLYYGPSNAVDGYITTSWQEGVDGYGIGEWIQLEYAQPVNMASLGIFSGSGESERHYYANARPTSVYVGFTLENEYVDSIEWELEDNKMTMQFLNLSSPVYADAVRFEIFAVADGSEFTESVIAELEVYCSEN